MRDLNQESRSKILLNIDILIIIMCILQYLVLVLNFLVEIRLYIYRIYI